MKSKIILLLFALATSIEAVPVTGGYSGPGIKPQSWLGTKIGMLRAALDANDLKHLTITHHPNNPNYHVMITNEREPSGILGTDDDIATLKNIFREMNTANEVKELPELYKDYALVKFKYIPRDPNRPIPNPSEASTSQTPSKRKSHPM